jgi:3-deoxy-7-phosphoheptulonate synthase
VIEVADVIQIGARNMQNYTLLAEAGRAGVPVLLKRGLAATLEELLMAVSTCSEGNEDTCERDPTFETATLHPDPMAVPVPAASHLPVVATRATRRARPRAAASPPPQPRRGRIIVEVHYDPEAAICDGPQAVPADEFAAYVEQVQRVAAVVGNELSAL